MKNKQVHARHSLYSPVRRLKDGTLELAKAEFSHKTESPYAGALSDEFSIVSEMPVNVNFFYQVEQYNNKKIVFAEKGLGEIITLDGRKLLQREYAFEAYNPTELTTVFKPMGGKPCNIPEDFNFGILKTYVPSDYIKIFAEANSVLCSEGKFNPTPVPLEEETLLGRLDGRIQSIDKDELKFILGENIKIAVEESKSPLKLQTDELSVDGKNSIIMTDQIQLRPMRSRPKRFSVGSLYYNRGKKTFEFHDGKKWRTLVTE